MQDFKKLKVVELRAELSLRNLPQNGKRDELIERLEEYEFEHGDPPPNETENDNDAIELEDGTDGKLETKPGSQIEIDEEVKTNFSNSDSSTKVNENEEQKSVVSTSTPVPSVPVLTSHSSIPQNNIATSTVDPLPSSLPASQPEPHTPISHEMSEEEKLQARARRFGLETNSATQTPLNIELTIRKLEHSLPVHKYSRRPFHRYKNNSNNRNRRVHYSSTSVNKP